MLALQAYEDYPKLNKVLASFYEALRLFRWFELPSMTNQVLIKMPFQREGT